MNNLTQEQIDFIVSSVEFISERELEENFDNFLESISEGDIFIFGNYYDLAFVLKSVDPIAYREEFNNWLDTQNDIYMEITSDYYYLEQVQDALDSLEESSTYNMAKSDLGVENE